MDLATAIYITVCGGHCKRVIDATQFFGVSNLVECAAGGGGSVQRMMRTDDADYFAIYKICIGASSQIVRTRWGRRAQNFEDRWWLRAPRAKAQ
ncbi:MAG: hypothetical protein JSR89_17905 [Proteobacteria bacterium]|nr:hypothetical protein [Pseudomonadota bacterium]